MKNTILIIALAFCVSISVNAKSSMSIPDSLPINDKRVLMSYTLSKVEYGEIYFASSGMVENSKSHTRVQINRKEGETSSELLNRLRSEKFLFSILSPEHDSIFAHANLGRFEKAGNRILFGGHIRFQLESTKGGGWAVPSWARQVTVSIAHTVPVYVSNDAQWAYIRDKGGWHIATVEVRGGEAMFPSHFAERDLELIVGFTDGSAAYNMAVGERIESAEVSHSVSSGIEGLRYFTDEGAPDSAQLFADGVLEWNEAPPLVQIRINKAREVHFFAGIISEGGESWASFAPGMFLREIGGEWKYYSFGGDPGVILQLPVGVYEVIYDHSNYTFPDHLGKG